MASIWTTGPALVYVQAPIAAGLGGATLLKALRATTPQFLGTFESRPEIEVDPAFQPVLNDLGGPMVPIDRVYTGKEARASGVMNRLNMNLIRVLMATPQLPATLPTGNSPYSPDGNGGAGTVPVLATADLGAVPAGGGIPAIPLDHLPRATNGAIANITTGVNPGAGMIADGSDDGTTLGTLMTQSGKGFIITFLFPGAISTNIQTGQLATGMIPGYRFYSSILIGPTKITPGVGDLKQGVVFQFQRYVAIGTTALNTGLTLYDHRVTASLGGVDMPPMN